VIAREMFNEAPLRALQILSQLLPPPVGGILEAYRCVVEVSRPSTVIHEVVSEMGVDVRPRAALTWSVLE
jgi:hypothetical protein